jgi:uncharacterized protein (TIGR00369 family)
MDDKPSPQAPGDPHLIAQIVGAAPFAHALGIEFVKAARGEAILFVPYRAELVGNPSTGVVHGGVITTLLDHALGCAVFTALQSLAQVATLDMRIDYMHAAEPGRGIFAHAIVAKLTTSIAFVRGTAYHDTPGDPIATSSAAFMLRSDGRHATGASPT